MTASPRVSVIVTCWNLGRHLDEAVDSVLAQTFQDFEIVVVDDGSTDPETRARLDGYARPRTRVLRRPHEGVAAARNAGIAASTGPYLCTLDADDTFEPTFLEKTVRVLDADPAIAFASTWLRAFGSEQWEWKPERCDLVSLLLEDTVLTASLVRRAAVEAVGGYDTRMPAQGDDDWDLWLTLVEGGCAGHIVREPLYNYRRPGSVSAGCWHGPDHLPLARYRFEKHRESYHAHLTEVLLGQEDETGALLRRCDELERYLGTELEPALAARRAEAAELRARVASGAAPAERVRELEAALAARTAEVAALRASMSWRVTGPLRRAYGWWLGERREP
jgi:glycosyltransferase involved in cell wall biosynthesis